MSPARIRPGALQSTHYASPSALLRQAKKFLAGLWDLPFPFDQTDFSLNQGEARWQAALLEWGSLVNHKIAIAQIAQLHHRFDPAVPIDKQAKPGSAVFAVVENTTKDCTVIFSDFNGFATDQPYGEHTWDLVALLA
jgi:hypothetical protein